MADSKIFDCKKIEIEQKNAIDIKPPLTFLEFPIFMGLKIVGQR